MKLQVISHRSANITNVTNCSAQALKKKRGEATVAVAAVSTLKKKKQRVINSLSEKDVRQRGQERKKRDYSSEARTAQQQTFYKAATMGNSMLD